MTRIITLAVLLLWQAWPLNAAEINEQQSGNLLLKMQAGYEVATRLNTDVDMTVSGIVARVTVAQRFRNDGDSWVEGIYVFPLPPNAAVDRLRMVSGERIIEGEIREKEKARAEYEQAKREGKRASLVGQQRANLFTTSVANIGPGEEITIEIAYLDTVDYDDGAFSLRFPMTMTPRYIPGRPLADRQGSGWSADTDRVPDASLITPPVITRSADHNVTFDARIDAGMPLKIIASRYHPVDISDDGKAYHVSFASQGEKLDHDLELVWRPVESAEPRALLFREDQGDEGHLLLMLMPPTEAAADGDVPARDLTFVMDTSGSMHGTSIEQARRAVTLALDGLRPQDRFNLIQFNSVTQSLFPASVPATEANLQSALAWVRGLQANGGTEMYPALQAALHDDGESALRQVVFVTDGAVGNEVELYKLIEARLGRTRLFTIGIGSAPNGFFMRKAAEVGRGTFVYISALHEVQEKMSRLLRRLRDPALTDIEVAWPDGLAPDSHPSIIADLYAGEPVMLRARVEGEPRPGDQLVVRGNATGGPWSVDVPLADAADNPGVAALWARAQIASLFDRERQGDKPEIIRDAVVATALRYGLVSKFTSLVAVDRTPVRPAEAGLDREQVPNLLPYGQSNKAIFGFPATATVGPAMRASGGLLLMLASLIALYRICTMRVQRREKTDS